MYSSNHSSVTCLMALHRAHEILTVWTEGSQIFVESLSSEGQPGVSFWMPTNPL